MLLLHMAAVRCLTATPHHAAVTSVALASSSQRLSGQLGVLFILQHGSDCQLVSWSLMTVVVTADAAQQTPVHLSQNSHQLQTV